MKRPRVLVDVDGVLADFLQASLPILKEVTGREYEPSDFKTWDIFDTIPHKFMDPFFEAVNRPGWCQSLPVFPGAVEGIRKLREISDVYIVTSPMNHVPTWTHEREAWLSSHFDFPVKKIVHTSAKYICRGDVLLDDRPSNIESWETEHPQGSGLLWHHPYNLFANKVGTRVRSWDAVLTFVADLSLKVSA